MRSAALAAIALCAACHGGSKTARREGSAAPVVVVNEPVIADAAPVGTTDEVEPNDSDDVAGPLALGGTVRGRIEPETDVDHYRIDVDKPGALAVTLSGVDQDLVLEIEDSSGAVIAKSDRGNVRTKEGVPNLGVTPGRYFAVVRAVPRKKPKPPRGRRPAPEPAPPPAPVYEIAAHLFDPKPNAEHEPDDDRGTANDLLPSDTVTGYIGWIGDQDVWKLSTEALSAKNVLDIELSAIEGIALEIEVQDGIGQTLLDHKGVRGEPLAVRNLVPAVAPGAPPFHYLIVRGDRSNPETTYQLHTQLHALTELDTELEPDDTPEHPFQIPADRTLVHGEHTYGDVDCYAVAPMDNPGMLEATIEAPQLDLAAEMIVDGKSAVKLDHPGKGAAEKLGAQVDKGSHVVICVRAGAKETAKAAGKYTLKLSLPTPGDNAP